MERDSWNKKCICLQTEHEKKFPRVKTRYFYCSAIQIPTVTLDSRITGFCLTGLIFYGPLPSVVALKYHDMAHFRALSYNRTNLWSILHKDYCVTKILFYPSSLKAEQGANAKVSAVLCNSIFRCSTG